MTQIQMNTKYNGKDNSDIFSNYNHLDNHINVSTILIYWIEFVVLKHYETDTAAQQRDANRDNDATNVTIDHP